LCKRFFRFEEKTMPPRHACLDLLCLSDAWFLALSTVRAAG
jgi:hypothetical protein